MADQLPINFPLPSEGAIASYNWTDLLDSTGYVTYYGFDNEADTYNLTQNSALYSKSAKKSVGGAEADTDEDFDIVFGNPQTVKGDLFVGITYYVESFNNNTLGATVKVKVVHYDGSSETVIGTQQTSDSIDRTTTGLTARRTTFQFSISTKVFKSGEILRVNVILVPTGSSASGSNVGYYFDPANRDVDGADLDVGTLVTAPSQLTVDVPFRINL